MTENEYQDGLREVVDELYFRQDWGDTLDQVDRKLRGYEHYFDHLVDETGKTEAEVRRGVAAKLLARSKERDEIADAMHQLGFGQTGTGGGCEAYILEVDHPNPWPHFLVTDNDCNLPQFWDEAAYIGYYPGELEEEEVEGHDTTRELIDQLRQGMGHPKWKRRTVVPPRTLPRSSDEDLEVINRHRASLGMGDIDPAAGWTARELHEMAERIRTTGRMNNPSKVKRRLLR